jgi:hypothetical protein
MTGEKWIVDFWLDPSCPLTRITAQWIAMVAGQVPLEVRWRVMSLSVLNEHREVDPEGDEAGYLWIPARIATAVQVNHGHAALGAFYDALWTDPNDSGREWIGEFEDALRRCGLPPELAEAGLTTEYEAALRASHQEAVSRIEAEVGTPILGITTPSGDEHTVFGPVITKHPSAEDALRLWQGTLLLASIPGFRELKS